ncbi:MAG: hypothetical protein KTR26_05840 [Flammeovirgaceae bacterium]|nr:hypothetical protein [Flammeovirgaceae bacterium]
MKSHVAVINEFDYSSIDKLSQFSVTYPKVMQDRINRKNWNYDFSFSKTTLKEKIKRFYEKLNGIRIGKYYFTVK